ncbi:GTP-binding protein [Allostreptomyces psammosilenae]|uniref:Signal recognition particle receptor subunit beta n=1 Tax=Allostreptomyces psammosilenae TaxID=1892865 RepID=A0A853A1R1_9ACTN|nr:ATP/GTP-binding protein [Allostreptomyces psammosilenae]NYI08355.1 signal recognition particle receptor subunit beta [Allostreptomyces psammosilenae]
MDSRGSDGGVRRAGGVAPAAHTAVKILIAGGFGAGKTTLIGSVSEVEPLVTEETLTAAGVGVDDLTGIETKETTTVAMDFGRITIREDVVLYLFGTPGQHRFWFMWDELALGALGAVVLVDTGRLDAGFASIDFFERRGIPFLVAVNCFQNRRQRGAEELRAALDLDPDVPLLLCDARDRASSRDVLVALVRKVMAEAGGAGQPITPAPAGARF